MISNQINKSDQRAKPRAANNNKNEAETAERRERNRYSARRSRIRKQRHYDELEKTQKVLMFENANLRLGIELDLYLSFFQIIAKKSLPLTSLIDLLLPLLVTYLLYVSTPE